MVIREKCCSPGNGGGGGSVAVVTATADGLQKRHGRTSVGAGTSIALGAASSYELDNAGSYNQITGSAASDDGASVIVKVVGGAGSSLVSGTGNIKLSSSLGSIISPSGGVDFNVHLTYDHSSTTWEEVGRTQL